ncbi:glutathione S-transferase family protein [Pseudoruegeria sp. SK021]|uniref:glutathione S-transferase family protein n=1 Tax=Pseudoruegeria sp. SK021 TaxID=1933035 RepID=UPI000A240931|nr:glutathione S-transferase family protein [Pseudoruegeria sp. SK021]OSP56298.1 hypothetical protein BV911_03145 [Pseudoruegeria sp. SK021]
MTTLKVTYFDFTGSRGEEVRLALALTGQSFDDHRITRDAFAAMKPDLPYGALPVLEVEGHGIFAQTNAILRLIGRMHGLYPEDPFAAARHDAVMDAVEDLRHRISPTMRISDPAARATARQQLARDYLTPWGQFIERQIGDGPFIGGATIGVADLKLFMADRWISSGALDDIPVDLFDDCPRLKALATGVGAHPAIQAWLAS